MENFEIDAIADAVAAKLSPRGRKVLFDELADLYLRNHALPHKRSFRMDESRLRNYLLPTFSGVELVGITRLRVIELHRDIGARYRYQANRVIEQLAKMINLAIDWGLLPPNWRNPAAGMTTFPESPRERYLTDEEITKLEVHINSVKTQHYRIMFWLFLLTGLRLNELVRAKWTDIDFGAWEFTLPSRRAKNGRTHTLPLPAEALALFAQLPRKGEFVFSTDGKQPLNQTAVWKAWNRIRTKAGLKDVQIHDLRRTFGASLTRSGVPLVVVGKALNHADIKSTLIYARFAQNDVREALELQAKKISPHIL